MKLGIDINEKTGLYLGTVIDDKWWKRYMKDKMFARGNGKYWNDDRAFYFHRYLTKDPISIPWELVKDIKAGQCHAGKWCMGLPILKILWRKNDLELSSGFLLSKKAEEVENLICGFKSAMQR